MEKQLGSDRIIIPTPPPSSASERRTFAFLGDQATEVDFLLPDEPKLPVDQPLVVGGGRVYSAVKTILDFVAAALILIVAAPFILVAALLVRLTSKGAAFYTQIRVSQGGKPYVIYKLRSMYHDCERQSGIRWSQRGDSRITPVGKWLRRTHIDELPQLWNVLRGEMSLIGPRPERPELVASLEKALPRYRDRVLVKPGMTGLAQIQLPPDTDLESVRRKLALDRAYIYYRGFWFDLKIYVGTVLYLVGVSYPTIWGWLKFPYRVPQEAVTLPTASAPVHAERPRSKSKPFQPVPV
jgi:lipopolysaccharide/colanic/teichoic acid biosynthesis glycosyltransferase